jgi:protein-tyrosine phosphatase
MAKYARKEESWRSAVISSSMTRTQFLGTVVAGAVALSISGVGGNAVAQQAASFGPPGTSLGIASVPNLRDVGGYKTGDSFVVRYGVAYRSNQLDPISAADMAKIAALGLKNDFDLRTEAERTARPDQLPPGVDNIWLNVLADVKGDNAAELQGLIAKPKEANEVLGGGKAEALFIKVYGEFITLPSANAAYRQLFVALATPSDVPALFHCTTGKDRTGWAAAALLTLLGVPEQQVYADYLRSNEYILPAYQKFIDQFVAAGGEASIPQDLLGVKTAYLKASFDEMHAKYGTIEAYFADGLGIDAAAQQRLRDRFLVKQ